MQAVNALQWACDPGEEERLRVHAVTLRARMKNESKFIKLLGDLIVTTRRVVWLSDNRDEGGIVVPFPLIVIHALSRGSGPTEANQDEHLPPCIYCQLDTDCVESDAASPPSGVLSGRVLEELDLAADEIMFVPSDEADLQRMYSAFSECAELNPDEDGGGDGDVDVALDAGFDGLVFSSDSVGSLTEDQLASLKSWDAKLSGKIATTEDGAASTASDAVAPDQSESAESSSSESATKLPRTT